jgi:serine/threonine protein kinase HipA of HipAB toxin-antitoxin module
MEGQVVSASWRHPDDPRRQALGLIGGSRRVDVSDSVQNEWLCAQVIAALGLAVAAPSMATFGGPTVLIVDRFDRAWMSGGYGSPDCPRKTSAKR